MKDSSQEILDVINEQDIVIGQATKAECHQNPELIHRTVWFTLIDKDNQKVLTSIRGLNKDHDAGKRTILGEHVITGETYKQGVIRGAKEELGISINASELIFITKRFLRYGNQRELVHLFFLLWNGQEIVWDKSEMEGIDWIDIKDVKNGTVEFSDMTREWFEMVEWDKIK